MGSVDFEFWDAMLTALFMGPLFGAISGVAQIITEEYGYKQISFRKLLTLRFIYALLFLAAIILLAYAVYGENMGLMAFAFEPGSFAIYLYILTVDLFMSGLRQVNLYLGIGNLWRFLSGRFYTPREGKAHFYVS